ncbi:hypothetical protein [Allohahella sp. A8]|uniref:hypothetical protein n=1 Tax=Allohahella sp. A8 TaxID=3141461 RepID=UPI003A805186
MLEFTEDPEWQRNREVQWQPIQEELQKDLTRKRVNEFKHLYMTGRVPYGAIIHATDAVELYPDHSIAGIQHCLDTNFPSGLSSDEFRRLQATLSIGVGNLQGSSRDEQVELFRYVLGETYDPERLFPFRLGQEGRKHKIDISAGSLFADALVSLTFWVEASEYSAPAENRVVWLDLIDFFFSLIKFVNPSVFTFFCLKHNRNRQKVSHHSAVVIKYLSRLLRYSITPPPAALHDSTTGRERKKFLADFRSRFESLDVYPGELQKIWREIRIEEGEVIPGPVETVWRKLNSRSIPDGQ